jgi:hypothetical protein
MYVSHGRASILFATLAGLSLALVTGGARTNGERVPGRAKRRIAVRAGIIFAIGVGLTMWDTPVAIILAYYGVLFLIALRFLRLRPSTNFVIAAVLAVLTPVASLISLDSTAVARVFKAIERFDPIARAGGRRRPRVALHRRLSGADMDAVRDLRRRRRCDGRSGWLHVVCGSVSARGRTVGRDGLDVAHTVCRPRHRHDRAAHEA